MTEKELKKYVAVLRRTIQTSEDTWNVKTETKICDKNTSVLDVIEWASSYNEDAFNVEIVKAT